MINLKLVKNELPVPDDHYSVVSLGSFPYDEEWLIYKSNILSKWLPKTMMLIPDEYKNLINLLSRDSLRSSLILAYSSLKNGSFDTRQFNSMLNNIKDEIISSSQGYLAEYNVNVKNYLNKLRLEHGPSIKFPFKLVLTSIADQSLLFSTRMFKDFSSEEKSFFYALNASLFLLSNGTRWNPYDIYPEYEINPLALWREGDTW
jgi:hypothetical protein